MKLTKGREKIVSNGPNEQDIKGLQYRDRDICGIGDKPLDRDEAMLQTVKKIFL